MTYRNTLTTYGSVSKFFHWLIFLLVAFMLVYGYFLDDIPKAYQGLAYNVHKTLGISILLIMLLRMTWRFTNIRPQLIAPWWELIAERVVHGLLYILLILMPTVGWVGSVAGGRAPHIGSFKLALPIQKNPVLSDLMFEFHNTIAVMLIIVISLHILAALYHHFIRKDNILRRMLPNIFHR